MNLKAIIKDTQNQINRLDKLAAEKRELLGTKWAGIEHKYSITNANIPTGDRATITRDLQAIETQADLLRVKLAELQAKNQPMTPQETAAARKEFDKLQGNACKEFERMTKALAETEQAAAEFEILRTQGAAIRARLDGKKPSWKAGSHGMITDRVQAALARLNLEIELINQTWTKA